MVKSHLLSLLSILPTIISGQVVVQNLDDAGAGSLRDALTSAVSGETITFAPALSGGTISLTGGRFLIGNEITIDGSNLPDAIKIDANKLSRMFTVRTAGSLTLKSLELTNGSDQGGGAIFNRGQLTMENCTLHGNTSFKGNGNPGGLGGAILSSADVSLTNCTLANNIAELNGGAMHLQHGVIATLVHCTITRNTLTRGTSGADSLFIGGLGNGPGPGINLGPAYRLENCIVSGNRGSAAALNSLLNNHDISPASLIEIPGARNLIGEDALLGPLADYGGSLPSLMPLSTSPAIDAGSPGDLTVDQRGAARQTGIAPDLGAVESGSLPGSDIAALENPVVTTSEDRNQVSGSPEGLSLREAIFRATPGSRITFAPGLSGEQIDLSLGTLEVERDLIIDAAALASGIALSGLEQHRVLQIHPRARVECHALTIRNGFVEAEPRLVDAAGLEGGGIVNDGDLALHQCLITENSASHGGGLASRLRSRTFIDRCTFLGNTAFLGGGARLYGEMTVKRSLFEKNGGISSSGGGLYLSGLSLPRSVVSDCTFEGNTSTSALTINHQEVINCTIVGNSGVGILVDSDPFQPSIFNCILWNNGDPEVSDYAGPAVALADNNLVGIDPLLGPLQDNGGSTFTMAPLAGSPAIDPADGIERAQYETDQRNHFRTSGTIADFGAVEFGGFAFPTLMTNPVVTTGQDLFRKTSTPGPANLSLREAIAYSAPGTVITVSENSLTLSDGEIFIHHPVTIDGLQADGRTTFDAQSQSRFFKVPPESALTVKGVHFQNGRFFSEDDEFRYENREAIEEELGGGAILALGDLSIQNCHFSSCHSSHFGGAVLAEHSLLIAESRFSNCRSVRGGGALWAYSEELDALTKISQSEFDNNEAGDTNSPIGEVHGAMSINMERAIFEIDECYFHQNEGGVLHSNSFTTRIQRSSFIANSGPIIDINDPGPIQNGSLASFCVQNSTFSRNNLNGPDGSSFTISSSRVDSEVTHCAFDDAWPEDQSGIAPVSRILLKNSILQNPASSFSVPFKEGSEGNYIGPDALLSPPGNYGGRWPSLVPLPGSPALEIGVATDLTTDQRGLQRIAGNAPDAGAVERQTAGSEVVAITDPVVTRADDPISWNADPNNLSLKQAIALATPASRITFSEPFPKLTLNGPPEILRDIIIDASAHPSPVQLKARPDHRALEVSATGSLDLRHFEISGYDTFHTEVVRARGDLSMTRCQFRDNSAMFAPVATYGNLSANECQFENNGSQIDIGGILHWADAPAVIRNSSFIKNRGGVIILVGGGELATLTIQSSTIQGNIGGSGSGAISSSTPTVIENSTIVGNSTTSDEIGGGISAATGSLTVSNSIIALNESPTDLQISADDPTIENSFTEGDPQLSPPAFYGGPTKTMLPVPGSPVIDAGGAATETTDQRGLPRVVGDAIDFGAAEFQGENAEFLLFFELDSDRDGQINGLELALGKDPLLAHDSPELDLQVSSQGQIITGYDPAFADAIIFKITRSLDLESFETTIITNESAPLEPEEGLIMLDDSNAFQKAFYRIEVTPR